jgi:hypothetical protein
MLATELLFVYTYCLIDDAIKAGALSIPRRPGPAPACTDAELLTIAVVRHLLGRRSENGFLAEIRRDWPCLFPHLPDQPEVNRRTRWLWGAFEQLRAAWAGAVPADPVQQIDTSAIPVKHPSRVRGPDQWTGQGNDLAARFGRDGAHAEWFYGFRLARLRNRVETSFKEITDQMELARHGAHTFEGLLTRTVAVLAAHTLLLTELSDAM